MEEIRIKGSWMSKALAHIDALEALSPRDRG